MELGIMQGRPNVILSVLETVSPPAVYQGRHSPVKYHTPKPCPLAYLGLDRAQAR